MNEDRGKEDEGSACGCGGGKSCGCSGGQSKWIWMILALAILGVLTMARIAQNGKKPEAPASAISPHAVDASSRPAGPTEALPRLLDFGATQCIPCKMMAPILEDLKKTYVGKLDVQFIDVWENPEAGKEYGINMIPTQIFYDATGKELFRHEGFFGREDILAKWKEFGVDLDL